MTISDGLYALAGFAFFALGIYVTKNKWIKYRNGTMDRFGVDIQLLVLGVLMIVVGLVLIVHFI